MTARDNRSVRFNLFMGLGVVAALVLAGAVATYVHKHQHLTAAQPQATQQALAAG